MGDVSILKVEGTGLGCTDFVFVYPENDEKKASKQINEHTYKCRIDSKVVPAYRFYSAKNVTPAKYAYRTCFVCEFQAVAIHRNVLLFHTISVIQKAPKLTVQTPFHSSLCVTKFLFRDLET